MTHLPSESKGRRWRWNIWGQEYHATRNPTLDRLSKEEMDLVSDWLVRHGHKHDEIQPPHRTKGIRDECD